jgi:hypothetical protein
MKDIDELPGLEEVSLNDQGRVTMLTGRCKAKDFKRKEESCYNCANRHTCYMGKNHPEIVNGKCPSNRYKEINGE